MRNFITLTKRDGTKCRFNADHIVCLTEGVDKTDPEDPKYFTTVEVLGGQPVEVTESCEKICGVVNAQ